MFDFLRAHQLNIMLFLEAMCLITAFLTFITKNLPKARKTAIVMLELNAAIIMFSSRFYYLHKNGTGDLMWIFIRVAKFCDYFFSFSIIYVMNLYLKDLNREFQKQKYKACRYNQLIIRLIDYVMITLTIILIVAQFTPFCYYFDSQNVYHRTTGTFLFLIFLPAAIFLEAIFVISNYKIISKGVRLPLLLFILLPFFATVLQFTTFGIAFTAMSTAGDSIILYVFVVQDMNKEIDRAHKLEVEMLERYKKELEETVKKRTEELVIANEKAENLLLNILPADIARELKQNPNQTISRNYPNATVLFTDIVDFTKMSSNMSAEETVVMLNQMTQRFDERAKREGIEKIKTIGDAYMAATGLTEDKNNDGAQRLIRFAQGLIEDVKEFNKTCSKNVQIRIGVNSGPLVAGVIGKTKFIYDVWGDTVNVASRMESTGEPMKIHVSEATHEQTKDLFPFSYELKVKVKGKGMMSGYLL